VVWKIEVRSILFLGPYGNLTTLYANILALHPGVVGLNHARDNVPTEAAFWDGFDPQVKLQAFKEFVISSQSESKVGPEGGSFRQAHAARKGVVKDLERISEYDAKSPSHVVWKESGYLTTQLRINNSIKSLLGSTHDISFVRPVRNPIHCLKTNLESWHWKEYDDTWGNKMTYEQSCDIKTFASWYIRDLEWFLRLRGMYGSKRFIVHFESDDISNLIDHAELECSDEWLKTASGVASNVRHRESPKDIAEAFEGLLEYYRGDEYTRITDEFIKPALI